ncbi:hypothetical protein [Streptomyces sp. NPDC049585]|uniref:hypothetical protein n=1 Tax=Streptomyces sp. NPDC049585 TaxID=3155154 RepID=UPI0034459086
MTKENPPTGVAPAYRPDWVPLRGHHLWRCGVHFDVVRVPGAYGQAIAARLRELVGPGDAGAIVYEEKGGGWTYFLLPPGSAEDYSWPANVERLSGPRTIAYIGVPALPGTGNTWPLSWCSPPTRVAPFVEPEVLLDVLLSPPEPRAATGAGRRSRRP